MLAHFLHKMELTRTVVNLYFIENYFEHIDIVHLVYLILLTHKAPPIICSRRQSQNFPFFFSKNNKKGMIFPENRLLYSEN